MDNTNENKRTCPFCGKEVNDTDQFCKHCDAYLKAKVEDDETKNDTNPPKKTEVKKTCRSCLKLIPKSVAYCPYCGKRPDVNPASYSKPTSTGGSYWVGFLLGLFLGIIGLLIAYFKKEDETLRGAIHSFIVSLIVSIALVVLAGCVVGCAACSRM